MILFPSQQKHASICFDMALDTWLTYVSIGCLQKQPLQQYVNTWPAFRSRLSQHVIPAAAARTHFAVITPYTLHPPPHPASTALRTIWREKRFHHGKMAQSHIAPKIYIRRHHLHSQCGHSYSKEITRNCLRKKLEIRSYSHRSKFEIQSSF